MVIAPEMAGLLILRERVVLVTGSRRRHRRGIASRLRAAGARVAVHYSTARAAGPEKCWQRNSANARA